jgi:hypothetical protein
MQVEVRHHRPGDVRAARGTLRGADGPPDAWRLTVGGRAHEPAAFESRGDCVWVVFRPSAYDPAVAGGHVLVGEMALLATESAVVLRCGAPTDVGTTASVSWGEGPDIFPLGLGPEPEPPIGAPRDAECQLVPPEQSRRASAAPAAVEDDSDPAYTDCSDDDGTASEASEEPEDDTFENPLDVEEEEQSDADSDEEFVDPEDEEDDQEDPDFARPASASDDDDL